MCCEAGELLKSGTSIGRDLTLSDDVGGLDPCTGCLRGVQGFEVHHWGSDALYETLVLLEHIVEVVDLQDLNRLAGAVEPEDVIHRLPASLAPLLSKTTQSGTPWGVVLVKNWRATAKSRRCDSIKSIVSPYYQQRDSGTAKAAG